jgi:hypothetical protein
VDVWPALPLVIQGFRDDNHDRESVDNIVALLEHSDLVPRITQIAFEEPCEDIWEAMHIPFPELTHLDLEWSKTAPMVPLSDSFLGGSAPQLRFLHLYRIPYLGLPKLLLSATHLTNLHLEYIPHSGYVPPEAMAACLSTLTSLEWLSLKFRSPPSLPDLESLRPPPPTRTVLPVLGHFEFRGFYEYLEYLVTRIDAPRLRRLHISFFNDIVFDTPQLTRFISRTPTWEAFDVANVTLWDYTASVTLSSTYEDFDESLDVSILCTESDWQFSFLEQVCTSSLRTVPSLSTLEDLYMEGHPWPQDWKDNIDSDQWLELLHSFPAVENLYLSKVLAPCVAPALQELVVSRTTEVFPNLRNIFVEELQESGPVQEGIGKFVAARQVSGHPIAVSHWVRARK